MQSAELLALTVPSYLQLQDLYQEISKDKKIHEVLLKLQRGEEVKTGFAIVSGRLFYKNKLVIPVNSKQIPLILRECHDSLIGGHTGVLRTLQRVKAIFYWSKMTMGEELLIQPEEILETRYNETGHLEVLLKWRNLPDHETSWMKVGELKNQFPSFSL
ncbi:hypothetical protein Bca101_069817 [Brassica carinata]